MYWQEFYRVEPFGEERDDLRSGQIAAAIYNVNRTKESQKVFHAQDFVMKFGSKVESTQSDRTWQNASKEAFDDFKAYMIATSR